jgi:hypothetical protein
MIETDACRQTCIWIKTELYVDIERYIKRLIRQGNQIGMLHVDKKKEVKEYRQVAEVTSAIFLSFHNPQ